MVKGEGNPNKRARPTSVQDVLVSQPDGGKPAGAKGSSTHTLTVKEIHQDKLTQTAQKQWSTKAISSKAPPAFQPELVASIYRDELAGARDEPPSLKRVMLLEVSQFLENYLWPNFDPATATFEHLMSIILMVNEKFREGVPAWTCFHTREGLFADFFKCFLTLKARREEQGVAMRMHERTTYLVFTINVFQSLEDEMVRAQVLRLVSLPLWQALSPGRLQLELHGLPQLGKHWKHLLKKEQKASKQPGYVPGPQRPEGRFVPALLDEFLEVLDQVVVPAEVPAAEGEGGEAMQTEGGPLVLSPRPLLHCERLLELLVDLLSQLPTRRFVRTLLDDRAILVKAKLAPLYRHPSASLYWQLVDLFQFYMTFPINDHTGEALTDEDVTQAHYEKVCQLQRLLFKHWPKLHDLALANCGTVEKREVLRRHLASMSHEDLIKLMVKQLRLVSETDPWIASKPFLQEVMLTTYERRRSQREVINEMPLYPTEGVLWDENQIPSVNYTGEGCLALPKLNLQFLTPHDYLLRNFNLFRLEATYAIREDLADALGRVGAYWDDSGDVPVVKFAGWARMALPLNVFKITEVRKPAVGEFKPAAVTADIVIDTRNLRGNIRAEWDELKLHDVLFLLTIRPPSGAEVAEMFEGGRKPNAAEKYGLVYVRGCEIIEVKDEGGRLMNDFTGRVKPHEQKPPEGFLRTLTVALDTAQYQLDMNHMARVKGAEDMYGTFNLLVRRKAKENNFKPVLESIRDLMNEDVIIPPWLRDIFLGYGDPGAAQWRSLPIEQRLRTVDFKDTFLNAQHLREVFPDYEVRFATGGKDEEQLPPYRLTFPLEAEGQGEEDGAAATPSGRDAQEGGAGGDRSRGGGSDGAGALVASTSGGGGTKKKELLVESYVPPDPGPYPEDKPRTNSVRFTAVQTEAIMSGVQPGLTMVVGPPGTGKTDTAVQIMHVLYHNCPGQRTLLITHSNQALNDLFQKIMERDVPARYLLRLGMGEQELETEQDFSRVGRVNAMLARRLELLAQVEKMARQFGVVEDVAYTCETAGYFWLLHVLSRWEKFLAHAERLRTPNAVQELFPFQEFFADAPNQPLFKGKNYEEDMARARGCFRHLRTMFQELEECRAFELLKGQADRVNYLMTRQAKIVAMTCTHAALRRREFIDLAFKYDNLLMEESGQILEIETFIPMLLQRRQDDVSRLKRVVLIGDHHQLPPVVQNMAIQKYSHLDQPLFTRFIRLGTPYVELNAQGRARPSIAKLYNWRYRSLGDLPAVDLDPRFKAANPGLAFDYQFINVPNFLGKGEIEPTPYFYQNLGEAEMVVSIFCFMRLMGYPAEKITILSTYNGQKHLIRDVVERRCAQHPLFGRPAKVSTVDKYQGQQNDYVLLSLVRTRVVGHFRDVRRLVVAMSRARLGLYIVGRQSLFANCFELQPVFRQLLKRPTKLALVKGESYTVCSRQLADKPPPEKTELIGGVEVMAGLVARVTEEQMVVQGLVLPAGVVPPPQYPVPAQQPGEEEGGVPEQPATTAGGADTEGEEGGAAAAAAAAQGGADGQQDAPTPAVKGDTGAAAAERGLKKLQG
uniref:Intron-binding protein aquarius n=1 Tax=Dunaliella tertiolecta TaxID=3047 RepID=A0A7S3R311_DUNTE|mmetsp:Transcript_31849/g.82800  ORF Transcript_31849/g.82800 Transcript_31849/m.82800 type:complete len:1569 (+) Transcript_31849:118-4824(+)